MPLLAPLPRECLPLAQLVRVFLQRIRHFRRLHVWRSFSYAPRRRRRLASLSRNGHPLALRVFARDSGGIGADELFSLEFSIHSQLFVVLEVHFSVLAADLILAFFNIP